MIRDIEHLKQERPDLVESFESMTREELLKQCYLECIDSINMEGRVALFMSECTNNMSNTRYTLDSLRTLINQKKEVEYGEIRHELIEDYNILEEIKKEL